ncbi:MAG: hypothetical protein WDZ63_12285 [Burkholderiales bacterium]
MKKLPSLLVFAALSTVQPAVGQERAHMLHETYCVMCHDSQVYTRSGRLAQNHAQIREQVDRWQDNVSLDWSAADIDLMTNYLARRYYNVPCPDAC